MALDWSTVPVSGRANDRVQPNTDTARLELDAPRALCTELLQGDDRVLVPKVPYFGYWGLARRRVGGQDKLSLSQHGGNEQPRTEQVFGSPRRAPPGPSSIAPAAALRRGPNDDYGGRH